MTYILALDQGTTYSRAIVLMQIQADLLGVPVVRPRVLETTALGAAYLAGLAIGYWQSRDDIADQWQVDRRFIPVMPTHQVDTLKRDWQRALERSKRWVDSSTD